MPETLINSINKNKLIVISGKYGDLLSSLETNSVSLVFLDPQYEKVSNVFCHTNYPLYPQSDYQIMRIIEQVGRILKPSAFGLL
jgi:hypothetical protein